MDREKFIQRRKHLGLTQTQLCEGICTQATLSKFERQGRTPSLSILESLCHRLGISVASLNDDQAALDPMKRQLNDIECLLMQEELMKALQELNALDIKKISSWALKLNYYYLKAVLLALTNQPLDDVWNSIIPILDDLDEHHHSVYARLAYAALGISYGRHGSSEKAAFYFGKIDEYLSEYEANADESTMVPGEWRRRLTLMTLLADYFYSVKRYSDASALVGQAINLSSSHNVTFWLPKLKLIAARSDFASGKPSWEVLQTVDDALAFARLTKNQSAIVQASALRAKIVNQAKAKS